MALQRLVFEEKDKTRLVCAPLDRTVGEAQGSICGPACPVLSQVPSPSKGPTMARIDGNTQPGSPSGKQHAALRSLPCQTTRQAHATCFPNSLETAEGLSTDWIVWVATSSHSAQPAYLTRGLGRAKGRRRGSSSAQASAHGRSKSRARAAQVLQAHAGAHVAVPPAPLTVRALCLSHTPCPHISSSPVGTQAWRHLCRACGHAHHDAAT